VHVVSDVRLSKIHRAELLLAEQSAFDVEMAIYKLKSHKSPGVD
jgi:hypothetical protein